MIAYQAPLPGEAFDPPGIAYVLPGLSPSKFSGADAARVKAVTDLLRAGGCPARAVPDARVSLAFSSCLMMPMVVALEGAGWSLPALRQGDWLTLAAGAAREAMTLVGAELGVSPPWFRPLLRRPLFSLISRGAKWLAPFDAEVYLQHHFTKVGDQTRLMMRGYLDSASARGLPSGHIATLNTRVFHAD
jgi:2-dehydropantoate 2-reductase